MVKLADKAAMATAEHEGETRKSAAIGRDPRTGSWCVVGAARVIVVERFDDDGVTYSELSRAREVADSGAADKLELVDAGELVTIEEMPRDDVP